MFKCVYEQSNVSTGINGAGMETSNDTTSVYQQLAELETKILASELESLRRKEFALKPLYAQRKSLTDRLPNFWIEVLSHPPEEVQECLLDSDLHILACLKSFSVERYEIKSETQGDPRSLRFTFEFEENEYFHDTKLVKEFRYCVSENGGERFVSEPVPIEWRKKRDATYGLLDAAVELYKAEEALKGDKSNVEIDSVERESLWQYEKLRKKLDQAEGEAVSFFNWFGYRGAILGTAKVAKGVKVENRDSDASDEEEDEGQILDVEIFYGGDDVTNALAEDLWPNVMDFFMAAQMESDDDIQEAEVDEESDEAPDLVSLEEVADNENRPEKRRRFD